MSNWYSFKPVDTLFFRGASQANMGEDHSSISIFPPPVNTIVGALRTTVLVQNGIDFEKYGKNNDKIDKNIYKTIGKAGEDTPFSLVGPFFRYENTIFIPAPFSWYFDKSFSDDLEQKIFKTKEIKNSLLGKDKKYWVKGEKGEVSSIGGKWIALDALNSKNIFYIKDETKFKVKDNRFFYKDKEIDIKNSIVETSFFFKSEIRTGIALEENRKVREGHLYSFTHNRLKEEVDIVWRVEGENLPLKSRGILKLGAEQRFGYYKKIEVSGFNKNSENNDKYLSLSLIKGSKEINNHIISTGKIKYIGGWDMKKRFHKEMVGYYPAGTVFSKEINNNLIKID